MKSAAETSASVQPLAVLFVAVATISVVLGMVFAPLI
jgi:hypothetical protein